MFSTPPHVLSIPTDLNAHGNVLNILSGVLIVVQPPGVFYSYDGRLVNVHI